ncbi:hypothetical protein BKA65DRAFT_386481 [Rhexocercosporidium sp. MPI-PUGE-AT-0058]|nr:hypothetical protein BKA65DRAFT_386481 [Rhexocercosporidium sp. MPI-PUGE-AT-0058]
MILETSAPIPKPKSTTFRITIFILAMVGIIGGTILITLLALDVFYIPYLSEFSKFLVLILSPFVPLLFPSFLGVFLKVCQHKTWPRKKVWVCITGSWVFQHLQRAVTDAMTLYGDGNVCGLRECTGKWLEWALVGVVVSCQVGGWKWDGGYVDRWIENIIKEEAAKQAKVDAEKIAKGEMPEGMDLEKANKCEGLVYQNADEEKRRLMARDEMANEESKEVLVVVDEQKI